jgi:hypothetical protein
MMALFAGCLALALAGAGRATTSDIEATGFTYSISGDVAVLGVDTVLNHSNPPRISGELYLELWAFPQPYVALGQAGYQQNGYKLASYSLGRLAPNNFLRFMNSGPIPLAPPPGGTWYITSFVTEYDASAINAGGYLPRAFINYEPPLSPLTFAPPAVTLTPEQGLWWDPTQVGTGYSINVRHGVAVVTVYTYLPDGTATWYIASGPLTNGGQSFSATLNAYVGGPCIPCSDPRYPSANGNAGTISIVFASPQTATVFLPGGRVANIVPASF